MEELKKQLRNDPQLSELTSEGGIEGEILFFLVEIERQIVSLNWAWVDGGDSVYSDMVSDDAYGILFRIECALSAVGNRNGILVDSLSAIKKHYLELQNEADPSRRIRIGCLLCLGAKVLCDHYCSHYREDHPRTRLAERSENKAQAVILDSCFKRGVCRVECLNEWLDVTND